MDRISRAGTLGHEEVLEEIEIFLNALARTFPDQPNQSYQQNLNQAATNVQRLIQNGNLSQTTCDRVQEKLTELCNRYSLLQTNNSVSEQSSNESSPCFQKKIVTGTAQVTIIMI